MSETFLHKELTTKIIGRFFHVYNVFGYGFLEKVFENALAIDLRKQGMKVRQQVPIKVYYEGAIVGEYFADMIVDEKVILEIKVAEEIATRHILQLRNYLRASKIEVGYVLNFGPSPTYKRQIYTNDRFVDNLKTRRPRRTPGRYISRE